MISPELVSEALVAKLRADAGLLSVLPDGAAGIREESWKGTRFKYPNVRIMRPRLTPWGDGNCTPNQSRSRIAVLAFSKNESSRNAQFLQGLIVAALEGERLDTLDLETLPLRSNQRGPAAPSRDFGPYWRGRVDFRTVIFPK